MEAWTYILICLVAIIVAFLLVIIVRTMMFKPKKGVKVNEEKIDFNEERAINNLQTLVKCKTVSYLNKDLEDDNEFNKLIDLLPNLYPSVSKNCEFKKFEDRGIMFRWAGKTVGDPAVLMAHYDVVPVNEENWEKPPFEGIIENGVLWGRGTLDTKVTFNGILSAADNLIEKGFIPEHDIYMAFSGGEEIMNDGAVHIVEYFEKNNITPSIVVDEGGAVVEGVFPGVKAPCGLIGIAEKGMMNAEFKVKSNGGHASAPKPHSPVVELSSACLSVENKPFKYHITKPVAEMFDTLGRHSSFVYRMIFANLWCFGGLLDILCKKTGGELNALMRTTCAFTQLSGSKAANVIPPEVNMVANLRLNPEDTMDSALEYLKKTVNNDKVEVINTFGMNPSRISQTDCEAWDKVASAVASTWKGALVSPYLMVQCSDSRHYGRISDKVYRFSAMDMTAEERGTIHGNNERIRLESIGKSVEFFTRLIKQC